MAPLFGFCQINHEGAWIGKIDIANIRVIFNVTKNNSGSYQSTFDSPDQSAFGLPVDETIVSGDSIFFKASALGLSYKGRFLDTNTIVGEMMQGIAIPLKLYKSTGADDVKELRKPQTPVPPFPYKEKEVTFTNTRDGIKLSGTLSIPTEDNGKGYPTLILITGSGAQDRDETMFGHKPFAVIADYFTRKGIMVLRYDDRGTGKSTGNFSNATTADFSYDAEAALQFVKTLPEADKNKIGFLGHSEGGIIAPMVAERNHDVNFLILLAAPGIPIVSLMTEQNKAVLRSMGLSEKAAEAYGNLYHPVLSAITERKKDTTGLSDQLLQITAHWAGEQENSVLTSLKLKTPENREAFLQKMIQETDSKWMKYFLNYNPAPVLEKVPSKILALNGSKDIQVLPESNTNGIKNALSKGKSKSYEVKIMEGLNHLFQTCSLCSVQEYGILDETMAPPVLDTIYQWMKKEKIAY